ncbi:MAG TPA: hypothetical protein VHH73_04265 [Verrucomicrobiae bacterium]|nr:hypothetical protein [Verrucomicrobiae bacterium]
MSLTCIVPRSPLFAFLLLTLAGVGTIPAANGPAMTKLSQFDRVEYGDLASGANGTLHAIFSDQPALDRPKYLYYRASTDAGKTWSEATNLSDDESGDDASYGRLIFDGSGRLYVVWKYVRKNSLLDGPGGYAPGRLVFRCLEGGTWGKRVVTGDPKIPTYSWFCAIGPDGAVHLDWSQVTKDSPPAYMVANYANLVRDAILDGSTVKSVKDLTTPRPVLGDEQAKQLRAAGKPVKYEDTRPVEAGLINLRGFINPQGTPRFVAESPGIKDGPPGQQTGRQVVVWDGVKLTAVHSFEKYSTYNNFNNPPALLPDAAGKPHLIRAPEKSEKPCVRDYPVEGGELGDFTNIIIPKTGPGKLANWQVHALPGGKMAVTAALSEKGGYDPDDLELYVSFYDGKGAWSAPVCVTSNQSRQSGFNKETVAGNTIGALKSHKPRYCAVTLGKDGRPCLLLIDNEDTIVGVTSPGVTASGRAVTATGGLRTDNPAVYFLKL